MSDGTEVCHKCDNPPCVNPDHLFLGTHAENMKDMGDKGRRIGKAQGEESGRARLAAEQIVEIRRRYAEGGISYRDLAARYGVGKNTIQAIIQRRSWRHVDA
jgi:Mor family transcriptional regulator